MYILLHSGLVFHTLTFYHSISQILRSYFTTFYHHFATFGLDVAFGFVALFVIKKLTDVLLAPGVKLSRQQTEGTPNVGAGLLEAFGYVGGSMLIIWVF